MAGDRCNDKPTLADMFRHTFQDDAVTFLVLVAADNNQWPRGFRHRAAPSVRRDEVLTPPAAFVAIDVEKPNSR